MTKLLLSALALTMALTLSAYELDGQLSVKWTGFKTEKKAPVSGTFKDISLDIGSSEKLSEFLKSAKVRIDTLTFDSGNPFRDNNITSTLFAFASAKFINATISQVDTEKMTLTLNLTMNEQTKEVPMKYNLEGGKVIATGVVEILDFGMKRSFLAFAQKCASFHENKSFSDVDIEFTLPYKN